MLPAAHRLRDKAGFALAIRRGVKAGNQDLVVYQYADQQSSKPPLVGFIVPKRAMKKATDRNRAKRQLRHLMREALPQLGDGTITVVRVVRATNELGFDALRQSLQNALHRALKKQRRAETEEH